MPRFWSRFVHRVITRMAPDHAGLPPTYRSAAPDDGAERPRIFDPALRQYGSAFRPGDPKFEDVEAGARWVQIRRRAVDHVLRRVAESRSGDGLILRGSRVLGAWFGPEAREPGDLDWVADPPSIALSDPRATEMLDQLVNSVLAWPAPEGVEFLRDRLSTDEIWTYERAPGRRFVFPWRTPGQPGGAIQVDVVFGETLAEPARWEAIPAADGGCVSARVAGPAQSLAWKLLWMQTDRDAQGKDLYDAVLLAERYHLPADVLEQTLQQAGAAPMPRSASEFVARWEVDWDAFRAEYPWAVGDGESRLARLAEALGPTFEGRGGTGGDAPGDLTPTPSWLTPTVTDLARGIAAEGWWDGLPILADALEEAGCDRDDLLHHCRAIGPHFRHCWAVDQILAEARG